MRLSPLQDERQHSLQHREFDALYLLNHREKGIVPMSQSGIRAFGRHILNAGGIQVAGSTSREVEATKQNILSHLRMLQLDPLVRTIDYGEAEAPSVCFRLREGPAEDLAPQGDTTEIARKLPLDSGHSDRDLEKEILLAMLVSPATFWFPSYEELKSAVRIRMNTVEAARKTLLEFGTGEATRPTDYWIYDDDRGFLLVPGRSLLAALQEATQPGDSGTLYTFSCRRASEYIVLLGMAREIMAANEVLYGKLQRQLESRALKGDEFERVFFRPLGSASNPLPLKFFVPGDRVWFRNPDRASSAVTGFEGSYTFYLGCGCFPNFWEKNKTETFITKCLSTFYWRNAVCRDQLGAPRIDENLVDDLVLQAMQDPAELARVLRETVQLQEPEELFAGGCIEPTRDCPRFVCPGTTDVVLPDVDELP